MFFWKVTETFNIAPFHPGLAEIFAPDGVSGSDIIGNFRQYNRRTIPGCKMVPKLGARWGPTICLPNFQSDFKQI